MNVSLKLLAGLACVLALHSAHALTVERPTATCGVDYLLDTSQPASDQLQCLRELEGDKRLAAFSRKDIDKVFGAIYPRLGLKGQSADADITILLANELKRRRPADHSRDDSVFGALMTTGRVDEAERLPYAKKVMIPRQPLVTAPDRRHVRFWSVQERPLALVEQTADLTVGRHVVVFTSPGCGFCQAAATDIAADPLMGELFKAQSLWINIPDVNYAPSFYREWSLKKYSFPTHVIFDRTGWPERRIPATPVFLFMADGKVVGEMLGWYGSTSLPKLARQLADLGFLAR